MYQLTFGTDGIRGPIGSEPFTAQSLCKLGHAVGIWTEKKYGMNPRILLAHDTRNSCAWVKSALKSGLLLRQAQVFDANVLPTPAIAALLKHTNDYDCGLVISASHNPYQDNGIKIFDGKRGKLMEIDQHLISSLFEQNLTGNYKQLGTEQYASNSVQQYSDLICSYFAKNFLKGLRILLDCANGATYKVAPSIFEQLGATVIVHNDKPNGLNINQECGSLHPFKLQRTIVENEADIGFAFDGDGDRVIAFNRDGIIKDGDDILFLLSAHKQYKNNKFIVGTVMSNEGFVQKLQQAGKMVIRAPVGDKYVAQELNKYQTLLGGEPSGHIICADYTASGDGIFAALRCLESVQQTNNWSMQTFNKFPYVMANVSIVYKKDLTQPPFDTIIQQAAARIPSGRLLLRYSGTEPLLRIMVEDQNDLLAKQICLELQSIFSEQLS